MTQALINDVLEEYGAVTRAAMKPYLSAGAPAEYLYAPMADYPTRGGKMMRPAILIATARALGAEVDDAVEIAVAIELLHNALLIHDDIEDESETRRGGEALHLKYGLNIAINAGDALALAALRPITDALPRFGPSTANAMSAEIHRMARETAEGQAMELGWRRDNRIDLAPEDYLVMVLKKTCWLATIFPCRAGAVLAGRGAISPDAFVRFGFFVGAAFQINDDILNIEADDRYGKEICGDLLEGKRTLMLIDLLQRLRGADRDRLTAALATARDDRSAEDVDWMRERIIAGGGLDRAKIAARGMVGAAAHECAVAFAAAPDGRDKRFLRALCDWTMARVA